MTNLLNNSKANVTKEEKKLEDIKKKNKEKDGKFFTLFTWNKLKFAEKRVKILKNKVQEATQNLDNAGKKYKDLEKKSLDANNKFI